jgi:hypothetical protein
MTVAEMCKKAHEIAVSKGWYDTEESKKRTLCEEIGFMHSEISEAIECFRDPNHTPQDIWVGENGKPEGAAVELADVLIRMGDSIAGSWLDLMDQVFDSEIEGLASLDELDNFKELEKILSSLSPVAFLGGIHSALSAAYNRACADEFRTTFFGSFSSNYPIGILFGITMVLIGVFCRYYHLDLQAAVVMKMSYNANRPYRHGGKRA